MGKDQIVTMTYLGNTVRAILNLDQLKEELEDSSKGIKTNISLLGQKIKVSVKQKGLFTFDKEGRRI